MNIERLRAASCPLRDDRSPSCLLHVGPIAGAIMRTAIQRAVALRLWVNNVQPVPYSPATRHEKPKSRGYKYLDHKSLVFFCVPIETQLTSHGADMSGTRPGSKVSGKSIRSIVVLPPSSLSPTPTPPKTAAET